MYIKEILKAENLPNWLSLIAVVAVLYTLNTELSRSKIEKLKQEYIKDLTTSNIPISFDKITKNAKKAQAMSELVRDGLAVQTVYGYEMSRFNPRLKDDINFATGIVLFKNLKDKQNIDLSKNEDVQIYTASCDDINKYIKESMIIVSKIEIMRQGSTDYEFEEYLKKHKDLFVKELFQWAQWNGNEYDKITKCNF